MLPALFASKSHALEQLQTMLSDGIVGANCCLKNAAICAQNGFNCGNFFFVFFKQPLGACVHKGSSIHNLCSTRKHETNYVFESLTLAATVHVDGKTVCVLLSETYRFSTVLLPE